MGEPILTPAEIPVVSQNDKVIDEPIEVGGKTWNMAVKNADRLAGIIPTAAGWMGEGAEGWGAPLDMDLVTEGMIRLTT